MRSSATAKKADSASVDLQWAAPGATKPDSQAEWLRSALHDFAQPLTTLECGLFLSTLNPDQDARALRQTIDEAMVQCRRMLVCFRAMQEQLSTASGNSSNRTI